MKRLFHVIIVSLAALGIVVVVPAVAEASRSTTDSSSSMKYLVGLGDSRAAGGGLPLHSGEGPSEYDARCERSPYASVAYLAEATDTPVVNYACVGATTLDVYRSNYVNGKLVPPQISQIPDFVLTDSGTTFVVQTGANDVRWSTWIKRCASSTCGEKQRDTVAMRLLIKNYEIRLEKMIEKLRDAGAMGRIVLVGAYSPVPTDSELLETYNVTETEVAWLESMRDGLNEVTRKVADEHDGVSYVDITLDSSQLQDLESEMPFHPTISGQQSIARQLQDAIESRR